MLSLEEVDGLTPRQEEAVFGLKTIDGQYTFVQQSKTAASDSEEVGVSMKCDLPKDP